MLNNILSLLPVATGILIISVILLVAGNSRAADLEREQRLADEIVDSILDGEPITLTADGHYFDHQNEERVKAVVDWLETI